MKNRDYPLYELQEYMSLNEMVYSKAEKLRDEVAFQYIQKKEVVSISYKKFQNDIVKFGKFLNDTYGVDKHMAILGENSYFWLVTFMAVIMSGNVAVLLDKDLDCEEQKKLLEKSDTNVCICSIEYWDVTEKLLIQNIDVEFVSMSDIFENVKNEVIVAEIIAQWEKQLDEEKLAAIFFTSGTSGDSKGVMLSQANMMADINMACKNFILQGNVLAVLPFHHAFGLLTAVLKPFNYEHMVFINSSLKSIKRDMLYSKPQTVMLVPLFVEKFYKSIWHTAKENRKDFLLRVMMLISNILLLLGIDVRERIFKTVLESFGGNLKYIICGGAALSPKFVKEFRIWGIEILNGYGITECSPVIAVNRNYYHRDGSVGQVLKGCDIRISEKDKNNIGEIQVKGANVMMGYYNDNLETGNVFVEGWFKTGDLGFIDQDGFLYITGRRKNLIILPNGENVSPEDLEQKIRGMPYVKEVIVSEKEGQICAEVFLDVEMEANAEEKIYTDIMILNKTLPNYKKIGKIIIRKEEFEKTTTRKIKRK